MEKRVTIRDIAIEAGVSTGTVHRAIYGKKGVSEAIRKKILNICIQRGYRTNTTASALKRGQLLVVGAFPVPEGRNFYFYNDVWDGFRRCMDEMQDYRIDVVELPYYEGAEHSQGIELANCYARYQGEIDALVTIGHFDDMARRAVAQYVEHEIPVFLACDDTSDCGRTACVQSNHMITGSMVAELLSNQLPRDSTILICAGDPSVPSHYETVQGFESYMQENAVPIHILKVYGYENERELNTRLSWELATHPDIRGAFSVSARLSVLLIEAVCRQAKNSEIRIIASDLFDVTEKSLQRGTIQNIVFKDPKQQAYLATKTMMDHLFKAQSPVEDIQYVESRIIFRSSLPLYIYR